MGKKIAAAALAAIATAGLSAPAYSETIVLLPEPGTMAPPTVFVTGNLNSSAVFVCASASAMAAGKCTLKHAKRPRARR